MRSRSFLMYRLAPSPKHLVDPSNARSLLLLDQLFLCQALPQRQGGQQFGMADPAIGPARGGLEDVIHVLGGYHQHDGQPHGVAVALAFPVLKHSLEFDLGHLSVARSVVSLEGLKDEPSLGHVFSVTIDGVEERFEGVVSVSRFVGIVLIDRVLGHFQSVGIEVVVVHDLLHKLLELWRIEELAIGGHVMEEVLGLGSKVPFDSFLLGALH